MIENEKAKLTIEVPPELEYFATVSDSIWKILKKYRNVILINRAIVKSNPVFLQSKKTGNRFAKFTADFESPLPWSRRIGIPPDKCGDVYTDCFAFENKKGSPGGFILENIRKGCLISGFAVMKSGKKPVKKENDQYRANWVYGDYIYLNLRDVIVDREAPAEKRQNPYGDYSPSSPYYRDYSDYQKVDDDEIKFNI